jgi:hypothetical protein
MQVQIALFIHSKLETRKALDAGVSKEFSAETSVLDCSGTCRGDFIFCIVKGMLPVGLVSDLHPSNRKDPEMVADLFGRIQAFVAGCLERPLEDVIMRDMSTA